MGAGQRLAERPSHEDFEFDYTHNVIYFKGAAIRLTPHEADILMVLLNNRARTTPIGVLIQQVYGSSEPETAGASIRVSIHSLRRKLSETGIKIKAEPRVGYEIDVDAVPELNRRLSSKILLALNTAKASRESEIVELLRQAYEIAEARRRQWRASHGRRTAATVASAADIRA